MQLLCCNGRATGLAKHATRGHSELGIPLLCCSFKGHSFIVSGGGLSFTLSICWPSTLDHPLHRIWHPLKRDTLNNQLQLLYVFLAWSTPESRDFGSSGLITKFWRCGRLMRQRASSLLRPGKPSNISSRLFKQSALFSIPSARCTR